MKLFDSLDAQQVKETWMQKDNLDLSYYGGKTPAFTPAVQGQDPGIDPSSGIQHYAALHNVFCNWEYTGWMDECNSIHTTGYIGDWWGNGHAGLHAASGRTRRKSGNRIRGYL